MFNNSLAQKLLSHSLSQITIIVTRKYCQKYDLGDQNFQATNVFPAD